MPKIKILQNMILNRQVLFPGTVVEVSEKWFVDHVDRHGKPPEQLFCVDEESAPPAEIPPLPVVQPAPVVVRSTKPRKNR